MRGRWLVPVVAWLIAAATAHAQAPPIKTVGHLVARDANQQPVHAVAYAPQPGDIILYDDHNRFFHFIFKLANTAPPTHTSIVIADERGKPALLELTGPHVLTARVVIMDVDERFHSYPGILSVRRVRQPLTQEQSRELTQFAKAQVGKAFAWPRCILQGTPFCARSGLRRELFGCTYLDRSRWFCSELVVAACASARIVDGKQCCGNATLPRDLAIDQWLDLSASYHAPVRWTGDNSIVTAVRGVP